MNKKSRFAWAARLGAAALCLGCLFGQPVFAHADTASVDEGIYVIRAAVSDKTVAVESNGKRSGANVFQWTDNSRVGERWQLKRSGGHYVVYSIGTKLVLDVKNGGTANGTNVQLWTANGSAAQQWDLVDNGDGTYSIKSVLNGLVLDISGGKTADGTNVQVWSSNGSAAQKFTLESTGAVAEGTYSIHSALDADQVIDVPSASTANGTSLQLWQQNGSAAQKWGLTYDYSTGYYTVTSIVSNKVFDIPSANGANGVKIQQYQANGSNAQLWDIRRADDGTYAIKTPITARALDVPSGKAGSGVAVRLWNANGSKAQQWTFEESQLVDDGLYTIGSAIDNSKVLDVASASMSPGARIQIYDSNMTLAQKWLLTYDDDAKAYSIKSANSGLYLIDGGGYLKGSSDLSQSGLWIATLRSGGGVSFANSATGKALDLSSASTRNGTTVGTYTANGTMAQSWKLESVSAIEEGTYVLTNYSDLSKALDVSGASNANGAMVQIYKSNNTGAQAWTIKSTSNGYVSLTNYGSQKALDVKNGNGSLGALVQQYTPNGTKAQLWKPIVSERGGVVFTSCLSNDLALGVASSGTGTSLVGTGEDGARWSYSVSPLAAAGGMSVSGTDASGLKYDQAYLNRMRAKAVQKGSDTNYYITVDVDEARVVVFQRSGGNSWVAIKTFDVTTGLYGGKWGSGTNNSKTGLFKLHHKARSLYEGTEWINDWYSCFVTAWTSNRNQGGFNLPSYAESRNSSAPYENGQGFHYSIYAEFRNNGNDNYKHRGSGCIDMLYDDAKWIYDVVPAGTTVESFASYDSNPTNWTVGSWPR